MQFFVDPTETRKKSDSDQMPSQVLSTSSSHFNPFSNDAVKQQRYREYLKLRQAGGEIKFALKKIYIVYDSVRQFSVSSSKVRTESACLPYLLATMLFMEGHRERDTHSLKHFVNPMKENKIFE